MFNDVVSTRDFPKGPNEPDDYPRFRRAADAFLAGQRAGTVGTLHIAAGNVLLGQELRIEQPNGAALFGRIIGEGPEVTTIRTYAGKRGITLVNPNVMEVAGFKLSGGPAKTTNLNHAGLVLGNSGNAVGHGCNLHDIRTEHYGIGLMLGDRSTGGAAAEIVVTNYGANQCYYGAAGFGRNTLQLTFINPEVNECNNAFFSDSAYGWNFLGGSLGNNNVSFNLLCDGEVFINGLRDEQGPNTVLDGGFIQFGGSASIRLIVQSCQVLDQVKGRTLQEAIKPMAGETTLIMEGCLVSDGTVSASKLVCLIGNSFGTTNPRPYRGTPTDVMVRGCVRIDRASGAPIADFPREDGPGGKTPQPPPPATPIYKVRWDNVGALTTANRSASVTLPLKFTNTGNVALGAGDKLTYWWIKDAKPGNYGDRTPLVSMPVGASWMPTLTVLVPSVAGPYTLRIMMVHEPSAWFSPLDISVAVT